MPLARRVVGILTLSMPLTEEHTLSLRALDIPVVSVGSTIPGYPSVGIDDTAAARGAVNHLIHLSHQRVGWLAGTPDDARFAFNSSSQRRQGVEEALDAAGPPRDAGPVAAVLTGSRAAQQRWRGCIGIDNHEMAAMLNLSTVAQDVDKQGTTAADLLVQVLKPGNKGPNVQPVILPSRLILRGTTAPPSTR